MGTEIDRDGPTILRIRGAQLRFEPRASSRSAGSRSLVDLDLDLDLDLDFDFDFDFDLDLSSPSTVGVNSSGGVLLHRLYVHAPECQEQAREATREALQEQAEALSRSPGVIVLDE